MTEGFANPVAAAGGALIRAAIKSPNYAVATAGWTINQDGTAEFNGVTIRGTLTVGDDVNQLGMTVVPVPLGPVLRINPNMAVFVDGQLRAFDLGTAAEVRLTTPRAGAGASATLSLISDHRVTGTGSQADLYAETITLHPEVVARVSAPDQDGAILVAGPWVDLTLNPGYSARGGSYRPQGRMLGPNTVQLRGTVNKGTGAGGLGANGFAAGDQPFVLPAGMRPAATIYRAVGCQVRASNFGTAQLQIGAGGVCTFQTSAAHDPGFVSLDGWEFDRT